MKLSRFLVWEYIRKSNNFKGNVNDTIFLDNETAITIDENNDFAKYQVIRKYKKSGELYRENNVSNSVLSMLVLSFVNTQKQSMFHSSMHHATSEYNFFDTLLDTVKVYDNDTEIAEKLSNYEGDILEFLLDNSRVVNESNRETYKEIINRVLKKEVNHG